MDSRWNGALGWLLEIETAFLMPALIDRVPKFRERNAAAILRCCG
jgi:hypothetical protein